MKAFTDIEQSNRLVDILPTESADAFYCNDGHIKMMWEHLKDIDIKVPCWSLAALVEQLPTIEGGKPIISFDPNGTCDISYIHAVTVGSPYVHTTNLLDACYEMFIKLHDLNLL